MDQARFQRLQQLFAAAAPLPPESWLPRLRALAAGDDTLVREALELLAHNAQGDAAFLERVQRAVRGHVAETPPVDVTTPSSAAKRLRRMRARPPQVQDRYERGDEIGRGGMGAVLRVRDLDLQRDVAMKVIRDAVQGTEGDASIDPRLVRFLDEAQITGKLDHPGVVPVHELGVDAKGQVYFTMRLVKGDTANVVFQAARAGTDGWTRTKALEVVLKVCDTMAFAHKKGVLHRDLKPANVMVGKFGEVYVMDWGLAKVMRQPAEYEPDQEPPATAVSEFFTDRSRDETEGDSPTLTGDAMFGTPSYMSPEHASGHIGALDRRTDVYAIGAMVYELLTGQPPYVSPGSGLGYRAILKAVLAGPPTAVDRLDATVPAELVAVCEKAMQRDLSQRYQNVGELAADLRAYLDRRVVKAYRTGPWAEFGMWMRRNRGFAAVFTISTLAVLVAAVIALWMASATTKANAEREVAIAEREENARVGEIAQRRAAAEQKEKEAVQSRLRSTKLSASVEERRVRDMIDRGKERQRVLDLVAHASRIEAQIVALACVVGTEADDTAGVGPAMAAVLDSLARELGGDRFELWQPWVSGRYLTVRGHELAVPMVVVPRPSTESKARQVARSGKDAPAQPRPEDHLVACLRLVCAGDALMQTGDPKAAVDAYLRAIDASRACMAAMQLDSADRGPLERLALLAVRGLGTCLLAPALTLSAATSAQPLSTWLRQHGLDPSPYPWASSDTQPLAPEMRGVRAIWRAVNGDLESALGDFAALPKTVSFSDLRAQVLALGGEHERAAALVATPGEPAIDRLHANALQQARSLLMLQLPHAALQVLDDDLVRLPEGKAYPALRAQSFALIAYARSMLGQMEAARRAVEDATTLARGMGGATLLRLQRRRAGRLAVAGDQRGALAEWEATPMDAGDAEVRRLPIQWAIRSGDRDALARLLSGLAPPKPDRPGGKPPPWVTVAECESTLLRGEALPSEALIRLRRMLDDQRSAARTPEQLRGRLLLARSAAALGDTKGGIRDLHACSQIAADRIAAWSRFQRPGPTANFFDDEGLEPDCRAVMALLAELSSRLDDEDRALAWEIVETCRQPRERLALTRATVPLKEEHGTALRQYHKQCAANHDGSHWPESWDLVRHEDAIRREQPVRASWLFPRVIPLRALQERLPPATALVVFATGPTPLTFIVARERTSLVAIPLSPEDAALLSRPQLAATSPRFGAALLGPILRSEVLRDPGIKTLLLAPDRELSAVPMEWCLMPSVAPAAPEPLLARFDVGYVASGSMWLALNTAERRGSFALDACALIAATAPDTGVVSLAQAAMYGALTDSKDRDRLSKFESGPSRLRLLQGISAARGALADLAKARVVVLSAPMVGLDCGMFAGWQLAAGDLPWTPQEARDLMLAAELLVLHDSAAVDGNELARMQALARFAGVLAHGGTRAVLSVPPSCSMGAVVPLVAAAASGRDALVAWNVALRQHWRTGGAVNEVLGARIWGVQR